MATDWKDIPEDSKEKYQLYLCSREWAELKRAVHERAGGFCERCAQNMIDAVHHLTYERKYAELLEDLQGICEPCHKFIHVKSDEDPLDDDGSFCLEVGSLWSSVYGDERNHLGATVEITPDLINECCLFAIRGGKAKADGVWVDTVVEMDKQQAQSIAKWIKKTFGTK